MKKTLLSLGLFAGATVSAFALASCAGPTTIKDLDGKDYTIQASEDAEVVSKALVLSAKAITERETKVYAIGADAKFSAEVETTYSDMKVKATVNASGAVKASIGTHEYNSYFDLTKDKNPKFTDEQIKAASKEVLSNFRYESYGNVDISLTASTEKEAMKESAEQLNGQKGKISVASYLVNATEDTSAYGYTEVEGNVSASLYGVLAMFNMAPESFGFKLSEDEKEYTAATYTKSEVSDGQSAPNVATVLSYYQKNGLDATLLGQAASVSPIGLPVESDKPLFDKNFFESDEFKALQTYVDTLGLKITESAGGKVTFAADFNGDKIKTVATLAMSKMISNPQALVQATAGLSKLEKDKKYLSASITLDLAAGMVSQVKVSSDDISFLPTVYQVPGVEDLKGKVSFEANCYTDGNVKFTKAPDSKKTYTDTVTTE